MKWAHIRPSQVKPFVCSDAYISRMLLDHTNSDAKKVHINHGTVKAGTDLLPPSSHGKPGEGHDETYVMLKGKCRLQINDEWLDLEPMDVVFIPGGTPHGLDNKAGTEDVELLTIWAGVPPRGINSAYDVRMEKWGKSYKTVDED